MSQRQIETCHARLLGVDETAAADFKRLMDEARDLAMHAWQLRRDAWTLYHKRFPRREAKR